MNTERLQKIHKCPKIMLFLVENRIIGIRTDRQTNVLEKKAPTIAGAKERHMMPAELPSNGANCNCFISTFNSQFE